MNCAEFSICDIYKKVEKSGIVNKSKYSVELKIQLFDIQSMELLHWQVTFHSKTKYKDIEILFIGKLSINVAKIK